MQTQLTSSNCDGELEASSILSITEEGIHLQLILPLLEGGKCDLMGSGTWSRDRGRR